MAELKKNTENKIAFCKKQVGKAHAALARYPKDIFDSAALLEKLTKMESVLVEDPGNGNLDPLFDLANAIIKKAKDVEVAIEKAKQAEVDERRSKSENALARKFSAASAQLLRYSIKMDTGPALAEKVAKASVAMANLSAEKSLRWIFDLCDEVFAAVNTHLNDQVEVSVRRTHNGWLTAKGGVVGKYAEPYQATDVPLHVASWLANKPLPNADRDAFSDWRRAGWSLVDVELKFPFGKCECGNEPLLPYQKKGVGEWLSGKLGRLCYQAGRKSDVVLDEVEKVKPLKKSVVNAMVNSVPLDTSKMTEEEFAAHMAAVKAEREKKKVARIEKNKKHTKKAETVGKDAPTQPSKPLDVDTLRLNALLTAKALADHDRDVAAQKAKETKTAPTNKGGKGGKGKGGGQKPKAAAAPIEGGQKKEKMFGSMAEMASANHEKATGGKSKGGGKKK